jgi:hypothetical protein
MTRSAVGDIVTLVVVEHLVGRNTTALRSFAMALVGDERPSARAPTPVRHDHVADFRVPASCLRRGRSVAAPSPVTAMGATTLGSYPGRTPVLKLRRRRCLIASRLPGRIHSEAPN